MESRCGESFSNFFSEKWEYCDKIFLFTYFFHFGYFRKKYCWFALGKIPNFIAKNGKILTKKKKGRKVKPSDQLWIVALCFNASLSISNSKLQIPLQQETHFDEGACCQNTTPLLTRNFILTRCLMKFPIEPCNLVHDARAHRGFMKFGDVWAQYWLLRRFASEGCKKKVM